jgi:ergothioneine biosynthesis protein EgtB
MTGAPPTAASRDRIASQYRSIRQLTETLCATLEVEDYGLQSTPDCSPPKWHLAHTTWFFETFLLATHEIGFRPFHPAFGYLFNSYYETIGDRWPRPARGLLSRPTVREVCAYRKAIDERVSALIDRVDEAMLAVLAPLVVLGLNHEQQHQELLLTDLKHAFALNPLRPVYCRSTADGIPHGSPHPLEWHTFSAGVQWLGHKGDGFAFDNESPRHRVWVDGYQIASRSVTVAEYLEFMEAGGYDRPEFWLSDGWAARQQQGWTAPLYWEQTTDGWSAFTLRGLKPLEPAEPVCHVSFYEADAFARWAGARLPTEAEWEAAASGTPIAGNFLDSGQFHPTPDTGHGQLYGDVWEWTASPYIAYPGYRIADGALGEYNGKFMCNQMVLRGGSCVTPAGHIRPTYRNFFPPDARWQFSGLRLAKDKPS